MRLSTALLFALSTVIACVLLKIIREGGLPTIHVVFIAACEEVTRYLLSRRLGSVVDSLAIGAAAAPLDYILTLASPSWRLLGVGPCDTRRKRKTKFGGCAHAEAHACYSRHANGKANFVSMAACYNLLEVPAGEAKAHYQHCHKSSQLSRNGFFACVGTKLKQRDDASDRCYDVGLLMANCARQYGAMDEWAEIVETLGAIQKDIAANEAKASDDIVST